MGEWIGLIIVVVGCAFAFIVLVAMVIAKFYQKVDQGNALIVNTMKKEPEVTFTGQIVYPIIHRAEIMDISLKTITVNRQGKNGLICNDNIRADIEVAFFVRVNKTSEDVLRVAQSVGVARASDRKTLEDLFQAKFSEALKTVGKQMDFVDLYNERDKFKDAILGVIGSELNGYSLEAAAIDYLEQTPLELLDADNILDAQGRKKIIDLTSIERIKANDIQRSAEKIIKKQDVEAKEAILALERQQCEAEAVQQREIHVVRVREQAEMDSIQAEEHLKAEQARIATDQELGIANQNKQREIEVSEQNRLRVIKVEIERVEKERQLEVINRERAVELNMIEKEKAVEIEKKAIADVVRERIAVDKTVAEEEERIKDLRANMTAQRSKDVAITKAQEVAEEMKIKEIKMAEASEISAGHQAKERIVLAQADQDAAEREAMANIRRAEGQQALAAADGLAAAKVKEAEATANEKLGMADVHVRDASAAVVEKVGAAEASAIRARMEAEASGLSEKADSMAKLNDSSRGHEEFRLRLENQLQIAKEQIAANVLMAQENAQVLAAAFKTAKIDIVGGDGQFFDRFIKAVSFGKSIDAGIDHSDTIKTVAQDYLSGEQSLPNDIKEILVNSKLGTGDIKNLMGSAVLGKLLKDKDPKKVQALMDKAKELGFGDDLAGWLQMS